MNIEGIYNPNYSDSDIDEIEKAYTEQEGAFLIAKEKRRIIGTIGVFRINNDFVQLRRWYLHPEFRGKGIGRKLLEKTIAFCRKQGYIGIITISEVELNRALKVYTKAGFKVFKKTKEVNYLVKSLNKKEITKEDLQQFIETKWNIEWINGAWKLTQI
jgi:putative acetyltransferase